MHFVPAASTLEIPHPYDPEYWRRRFASEPYATQDDRFEDFEPAYRFGHSLQGQFDDFDLWEDETASLWDTVKGDCRIPWERARQAIRAAWEEAERRAQSRLDAALQQGAEKIGEFVHRMKEAVLTRPTECVLAAAAGGYLGGKLPVRSLFKGAMGAALVLAPGGLLALGLWYAGRRINGSQNQSVCTAPVIMPDGMETADTVGAVILTDVA
ncbi:MAG TPA: hypothetical protein VHM91_11180 [Verrucomicrobiales bacterium]|jgi:hypothetical protein|nr:hypothetical protein [Verrucomicrobiales bacterium]